jgi:hypothetical protein
LVPLINVVVFPLIFLLSCVSANLSKVDADQGFDWNALKRDQIVMTPLLDLRQNVETPPGFDQSVGAFSEKESLDYPESFKQAFFKRRKDIRVFGAGGAFEKISKIQNLKDIGAKVLRKETLPPEDVQQIRAANQDIRFVFFFVFAKESLTFAYEYRRPEKKHYVEKVYHSTRNMTVKLALWDAKEAKTVWIGEKELRPTNSNIMRFKKPGFFGKIPKEDQNIKLDVPDAFDFVNPSSFSFERERHGSRFPGFPDREPSFSGSFDDFAMTLPLNPSEANLIEYEHFSNHRFQLGASGSQIGKEIVGRLHVNVSSRIYNLYRVGADVFFNLNAPKFTYLGKKYEVSSAAFGLSNDLEWDLSDRWRLMTGAAVGGLTYRIRDVQAAKEAQSKPDDKSEKNTYDQNESLFFVRPRIHLLMGSLQGAQLGFGPYYVHTSQPKHKIFEDYPPAKWGLELTASYTWRGF